MRLTRRLAVGVLALLALAAQAPPISVKPYDAGSWREIAAANAEKPFIFHVWGLSCGPCLAELPRWGEFVSANPDIKLVLLNWDGRVFNAVRVKEALQKAGLGKADHWAVGDGYEEKLRFEIDPDWLGEMPYTRMIGADGDATAFSGAADFAIVNAWVARQRQSN